MVPPTQSNLQAAWKWMGRGGEAICLFSLSSKENFAIHCTPKIQKAREALGWRGVCAMYDYHLKTGQQYSHLCNFHNYITLFQELKFANVCEQFKIFFANFVQSGRQLGSYCALFNFWNFFSLRRHFFNFLLIGVGKYLIVATSQLLHLKTS